VSPERERSEARDNRGPALGVLAMLRLQRS